MYYEVIYSDDGILNKKYPQSKEKAEQLLESIRSKGYQLITCDACEHYEAYQRGSEKYMDYILRYNNEPSYFYVSEDGEQDAIDNVLLAPFEVDRDVAYYILCENESVKSANEFWEEAEAL